MIIIKIKNIIQKIENFIYSEGMSDGFKTSLAIVLPPLLHSFIGDIKICVTISIGAIIAHLADTPGPLQERKLIMYICIFFSFIISFLTKTLSSHHFILSIIIIIIVFWSNMISIYGARYNALGVALMLSMVTSLNNGYISTKPIFNSYLIITGTIWYTILSFGISKIRPFGMINQNLSDIILLIANYIKEKSNVYDIKNNYKLTLNKLLKKYTKINDKEKLVKELIFNNKKIIKANCNRASYLILLFNNITEIFENIAVNEYDYKEIKNIDEIVLNTIKNIMIKISKEIEIISFCVKSNKKYKSKIYNIEKEFKSYKLNNTNNFIVKNIYSKIEYTIEKIKLIDNFIYINNSNIENLNKIETNSFKNKYIELIKKLKNNLNLKSNIFRHSIRCSIASILGYILTILLPFTKYSYWILMTILVILKPGFSVTKKRNFARLKGTSYGCIIGFILLFLIKNEIIKFIIMLLFMLLAYAYIRRKYATGTFFLTSYVLIAFSFFSKQNTDYIIYERFLDTILGVIIAFICVNFIFPYWEKNNINNQIKKTIICNNKFILYMYTNILNINNYQSNEYKLLKKNLFISMANINSLLERVEVEPKCKKNILKELNKFVVLNQSFVSYSVEVCKLIYDIYQEKKLNVINKEHSDLIINIILNMNKSLSNNNILPNNVNKLVFNNVDKTIEYESKIIYNLLKYMKEITNEFNATICFFNKK